MDKCIEILKSGSRKGQKCGASKKVIDFVNGKEVPHCNRHRIKSKQKDDVVDILTNNLNKSLKISKNKKIDNSNKNNKVEKDEIIEFVDSGEQNILNELDKQLDNIFNEYGL